MNREDFPLIMAGGSAKADCCLDSREKGMLEGLVYLDNAATMQKPRAVIDAVKKFYEYECANTSRGLYGLSLAATERVAEVRQKVADFVGAKSANEIIFTTGTTEGLNMAAVWQTMVSSDDEMMVARGEHHSNILPWAQIAGMTGARFRLVECEDDGTVDIDDFMEKLTPNTKVVTLNYIGNVFGGENRIKKLFNAVHKKNKDAVCVLDAAQAVAHKRVNVTDLGADIMVFSGHKIGAPMGIGALYARQELLETAEPIWTGGGMVDGIQISEVGVVADLKDAPQKFEAGTMNVEGIVGLSAAIDYIEGIGYEKIREHERDLTNYMLEQLEEVADVYGGRNGIVAFNVAGVHAHDTAQILAGEGIAVRAGWHCAQPLLEHLEIGPVVRASLAIYNTKEEIDKLIKVLAEVPERMGYEDV